MKPINAISLSVGLLVAVWTFLTLGAFMGLFSQHLAAVFTEKNPA